MKRTTGVAMALALTLLATIRGQQAQVPPGPEYVPGEVLVQYTRQSTPNRRAAVLSSRRARLLRRYAEVDIDRVQLAAGESLADALRAFRALSDVAAVQPNYIRHIVATVPNDPQWATLWGMMTIQMPQAWDLARGDGSVMIMDIDTGIDYNHEDLAANVWNNPGETANGIDDDGDGYVDDLHGINSITGLGDPLDDNGHGTHTAGTLAAVGNNGKGVVGVNWNAKVIACKFLDLNGSGNDGDAIECLNYAVLLKTQKGINIRVTSNSWGGYRGNDDPTPLKNAFDAAGNAGIISFAAAGNAGRNIDIPANRFDPASFSPVSPSVVAVASTTSTDALSSFSNYGPNTVALAAPGSGIISTLRGNMYGTASGTSMATPHVAGVAALLSSMDPTLNVLQLKALITGNVDVLASLGGIVTTGGRLNAFRAASAVGVGSQRTNVALAANGGVASASSSYSSLYPPSGANNGDRTGVPWGNGGGWNDGTANAWPDWLEIDFSGTKTINEVDVFSVQDNYLSPSAPTPSMTFSLNGLRDFQVQYWTGTTWQNVTGGAIVGNNLVWRSVTFGALSTTRIRVNVTAALNTWSRITEVEAWTAPPGGNQAPSATLTGPPDTSVYTQPASVTLNATATDPDQGDTIDHVTFFANGNQIGTSSTPVSGVFSFNWTNVAAGNYTLTAAATDNHSLTGGPSNAAHITVNPPVGRTNVALATNGGVAVGSSSISNGYAPAGANNGDRTGAPWGNGGGWNDGTANSWPDWLEIDFNGSQTINEIDVFSVQDNYSSPSAPTSNMTFTLYGLRDLEVQYWIGNGWQDVPGGLITSNNLVWRQVTFGALTTTKIRVLVDAALNTWSRITEVEAWSTTGTGNTAPTATLTGPPDNSTYSEPASIPLAATAADPDLGDTIDHVTFYANGNSIGTSFTPVAGVYSFTWMNVVAGNYTLTAVATDNHTLSGAPSNASHVTVNGAAGRTNVALASNGGVALASSSYDGHYLPSGANNGDRMGAPWGNGGGWNDATPNSWPDWLEIDFSASHTINEIDVFSVQDNYLSPTAPTSGMTYTLYGLRDFEVQYWTGSTWQDVQGGAIASNNLVWRQLNFTAVTTTKIRILVGAALNTWSRITEVEAWTVPGGEPTAFALGAEHVELISNELAPQPSEADDDRS